jgi:hypothetical protein
MYKLKRYLLGFILLLNIIIGVTLSRISTQIYRFNRLHTFIATNPYEKFLMDLQDKLMIVWIIWGALSVFVIVQIILEFRK